MSSVTSHLALGRIRGHNLQPMKTSFSGAPGGRVASLHLHPAKPGEPLQQVEAIEVVADKGILDEPRYFGRTNSSNGKPTRRQVSLIEREQIAEHAVALGLESIPPGAVRANIETVGIDLVALAGQQV